MYNTTKCYIYKRSQTFNKNICKYNRRWDKSVNSEFAGRIMKWSDCSLSFVESLLCLSDQSCLLAGASQQKCHKTPTYIIFTMSWCIKAEWLRSEQHCLLLNLSVMPSAFHIWELLMKCKRKMADKEQMFTLTYLNERSVLS